MPILNFFQRGIVNDPRDQTNGVCRVVTNFDIVTNPNTLVPYVETEDGNSNASNDLMANWCIANLSGTYKLYGLGRQTAAARVRIFYKALTTGAATDLDDNAWTETSNNTASAQTVSIPGIEANCFVYYPKLNMIFGLHGSRYVYEYDPDGGTAFNETDADLTSYTHVAQGIVHSKDDILYIPYDNKIAKNDNGSWTVAALTLPSQYYITSICEFNNYIAILCAHVDGVSNSRLFIWDRSTTLATISESIDAGSGVSKVLEEIGGYLVWISLDGSNSTRFKDRIIFRYFTGAGYVQSKEILVSTGANLLQSKQKINNRIYFMMAATLNGSVRSGVWSFGRLPDGTWNLVHERTQQDDTAIGNGTLRGFFYVGDYLFQAFVDNSSVHQVTKTDDGQTYTHTSIYESQINPNMAVEDRLKLKQLTSVVIGYETLAAVAGQVVVKYKVDGGSLTTIATCTTTGVNQLEFKDAAGVPFTKGREFEFKLESTLGAKIISFEYNYEPIPTLA